MISVTKGDCEFDRKSDSNVEENEEKHRVSGDAVIRSTKDEESLVNSGVELDSVVPQSEKFDEVRVRVRVSSESDSNCRYNEMVTGVFEDEKNKVSVNQIGTRNNDHFETSNDGYDDRNDRLVSNVSKVEGHVDAYKSLLSEFDDFVANEKMNVGASRALSYGFDVGDMVWGKVKSHPWWPGHIFNEAFATASVRRTRRDGHVLVAFFGDSSYGWFDPAELIPFDPHFMEKSQQTNSRTFVKAVEEAVDEASRRRGLGLACKCRNPYNFRPTNVQGYFAVDVPDFEPGGFYSANQIKKARDGFHPADMLSFVKQLASAPRGCEQMNIDFAKNKATVFAFRKAVFEEFDETYAQAFGVQSARPSHNRTALLDQSVRQPSRAPLSGPLVIAEALGGGKSSKKPMKGKDHSKKDRYLFKRRDEPSDARTPQISQGQAISSSPSAVMEGSSLLTSGDYVLQKRAPALQTTVKLEETGSIGKDTSGSSGNISGKESATIDHVSPYNGAAAIRDAALDVMSSTNISGGLESDVVLASASKSASDILGKMVPSLIDGSTPSAQQEKDVMADIKNDESAKISKPTENLQQSEPSFSARGDGGYVLDQARDSRMSVHPLPTEAKRSVGVSPDGKIKKPKVLKRPVMDKSSENSVIGEQKKKKKKKELGSKTSLDNQQKRLALGRGENAVGNLTKKSSQAGLVSREDSRVNNQKKNVVDGFAVSNSVGTLLGVNMGKIEVGLPQLLNDLHALALDPFHGVDRNCPAIIRHCFLRFRSLVYQKSLVLSPPSETEPIEVHTAKSSLAGSGENAREFPASKPVKHLARPDDPTKAGRKRLLSDRQEEIAAKRLKKISHMKSLTAEKKAGQRTLDGQRVEGKEHVAIPLSKPVKSDSVRKLEPPARVVEPTMLVMKFPPGTSLPSVAELKARLGRFGSIDQSAIRVFWKSSTCRVVFRHKADAQAAYKYANGNALFGNVNVRYIIRDVEAPAPEVLESDKGRGDDASNDNPRMKDPMVGRPTLVPVAQPPIQLKSCLKKPTGEEITGGNNSRGTARVKFMLGGEETGRGEPLMVGNRNNLNNNATTFADGGAPSSVAMDLNSKNFQKVIPPFSSPMPPPQFSKPILNNSHHTEVCPRNSHNLSTPTVPLPPSAPSVDISQQMLSLLTRCNDVVTNVTGLLGYVPYHPL